MRFYQEITLIKTPEITPYFIWSKLYMQVHLAFVEQQNPDKTVNFGVSFPNYHFANLGDKLRIFANTENELQQLNLNKWLERLADYVLVEGIQSVPENVKGHLLVTRYRANTNLERLTRRFMRRESKRLGRELSFEEAQTMQNQRFAEKQDVSLQKAEKHYQQPQVKDYPFIKMQSLSGGRDFSLQIIQEPVSQPHQGRFNTYGLSGQSTVPNFA